MEEKDKDFKIEIDREIESLEVKQMSVISYKKLDEH